MRERRVEPGQRPRGPAPPEVVGREGPGRLPGDGVRGRGGHRLGDRRVVLRAELDRDVPVEDLLDLVVVEAIALRAAPDHARPALQRGESLEHDEPLHPPHRGDQVRAEGVALHRADVEDRALLLRQAGDAGADQVANRGGDLDLLDEARRDERAVLLPLDEVPLAEPPDHLEHEERDAVRLVRDLGAELVRERLAPERVPEELDDLPR